MRRFFVGFDPREDMKTTADEMVFGELPSPAFESDWT
jgi:hypothetical protein